MSGLVNRRNKVPELQKYYQNSEKIPIYMRGNGPTYIRIYAAIFTVGILGVSYGLVNMARGKKN